MRRLLDQFQRALQRGNRAETADGLQQLIAARVPLEEQWLQLALMAIDLGEIGSARRAADLYVESCGGSPAARFQRAGVLARIGLFDEVIVLLRALPANVPNPFSYALARGSAALHLARRTKPVSGWRRPSGRDRNRARYGIRCRCWSTSQSIPSWPNA